MSLNKAERTHEGLSKKARQHAEAHLETAEEKQDAIDSYGEKTAKLIQQYRTLIESKNADISKQGKKGLASFIKEMEYEIEEMRKHEYKEKEETKLKRGETAQASFKEQSANYNRYIPMQLKINAKRVERAKRERKERETSRTVLGTLGMDRLTAPVIEQIPAELNRIGAIKRDPETRKLFFTLKGDSQQKPIEIQATTDHQRLVIVLPGREPIPFRNTKSLENTIGNLNHAIRRHWESAFKPLIPIQEKPGQEKKEMEEVFAEELPQDPEQLKRIEQEVGQPIEQALEAASINDAEIAALQERRNGELMGATQALRETQKSYSGTRGWTGWAPEALLPDQTSDAQLDEALQGFRDASKQQEAANHEVEKAEGRKEAALRKAIRAFFERLQAHADNPDTMEELEAGLERWANEQPQEVREMIGLIRIQEQVRLHMEQVKVAQGNLDRIRELNEDFEAFVNQLQPSTRRMVITEYENQQREALLESPQGSLIGVLAMTEQLVEADPEYPNGQFRPLFAKIRIAITSDPNIIRLDQLTTSIPTADEHEAARLHRLLSLINNTCQQHMGAEFDQLNLVYDDERIQRFDEEVARAIEQLEEKHPSALFRLELIGNLMNPADNPLAGNPIVIAYHNRLGELLASGEASTIPEARRMLDGFGSQPGEVTDGTLRTEGGKRLPKNASRLWEMAFADGKRNTLNAGGLMAEGGLTIDRLIGVEGEVENWYDGRKFDMQEGLTKSNLMLRVAKTIRARGGQENIDQARRMLIEIAQEMIRYGQREFAEEIKKLNLQQVWKKAYTDARRNAYYEMATPERRKASALSIAKEVVPNANRYSSEESLLTACRAQLAPKDLDVMVEQGIVISAEAIAEKAAEAASNCKLVTFLTDPEVGFIDSLPHSESRAAQLAALQTLRDSYGGGYTDFNLSDETVAWVEYIGEEVTINATLLAISGGMANVIRSSVLAGVRVALRTGGKEAVKLTLKEVLEQQGRSAAVRMALGRAASGTALHAVEAVAFHEVNTLLHTAVHGGDVTEEWWKQSWMERKRGWAQSFVMLGGAKGMGSAWQAARGTQLAKANQELLAAARQLRRANRGMPSAYRQAMQQAQRQALRNSLQNFTGGVIAETAGFTLASLDPEQIGNPATWGHSLTTVLALRAGGNLPANRVAHKIGAKAKEWGKNAGGRGAEGGPTLPPQIRKEMKQLEARREELIQRDREQRARGKRRTKREIREAKEIKARLMELYRKHADAIRAEHARAEEQTQREREQAEKRAREEAREMKEEGVLDTEAMEVIAEAQSIVNSGISEPIPVGRGKAARRARIWEQKAEGMEKLAGILDGVNPGSTRAEVLRQAAQRCRDQAQGLRGDEAIYRKTSSEKEHQKRKEKASTKPEKQAKTEPPVEAPATPEAISRETILAKLKEKAEGAEKSEHSMEEVRDLINEHNSSIPRETSLPEVVETTLITADGIRCEVISRGNELLIRETGRIETTAKPAVATVGTSTGEATTSGTRTRGRSRTLPPRGGAPFGERPSRGNGKPPGEGPSGRENEGTKKSEKEAKKPESDKVKEPPQTERTQEKERVEPTETLEAARERYRKEMEQNEPVAGSPSGVQAQLERTAERTRPPKEGETTAERELLDRAFSEAKARELERLEVELERSVRAERQNDATRERVRGKRWNNAENLEASISREEKSQRELREDIALAERNPTEHKYWLMNLRLELQLRERELSTWRERLEELRREEASKTKEPPQEKKTPQAERVQEKEPIEPTKEQLGAQERAYRARRWAVLPEGSTAYTPLKLAQYSQGLRAKLEKCEGSLARETEAEKIQERKAEKAALEKELEWAEKEIERLLTEKGEYSHDQAAERREHIGTFKADKKRIEQETDFETAKSHYDQLVKRAGYLTDLIKTLDPQRHPEAAERAELELQWVNKNARMTKERLRTLEAERQRSTAEKPLKEAKNAEQPKGKEKETTRTENAAARERVLEEHNLEPVPELPSEVMAAEIMKRAESPEVFGECWVTIEIPTKNGPKQSVCKVTKSRVEGRYALERVAGDRHSRALTAEGLAQYATLLRPKGEVFRPANEVRMESLGLERAPEMSPKDLATEIAERVANPGTFGELWMEVSVPTAGGETMKIAKVTKKGHGTVTVEGPGLSETMTRGELSKRGRMLKRTGEKFTTAAERAETARTENAAARERVLEENNLEPVPEGPSEAMVAEIAERVASPETFGECWVTIEIPTKTGTKRSVCKVTRSRVEGRYALERVAGDKHARSLTSEGLAKYATLLRARGEAKAEKQQDAPKKRKPVVAPWGKRRTTKEGMEEAFPAAEKKTPAEKRAETREEVRKRIRGELLAEQRGLDGEVTADVLTYRERLQEKANQRRIESDRAETGVRERELKEEAAAFEREVAAVEQRLINEGEIAQLHQEAVARHQELLQLERPTERSEATSLEYYLKELRQQREEGYQETEGQSTGRRDLERGAFGEALTREIETTQTRLRELRGEVTPEAPPAPKLSASRSAILAEARATERDPGRPVHQSLVEIRFEAKRLTNRKRRFDRLREELTKENAEANAEHIQLLDVASRRCEWDMVEGREVTRRQVDRAAAEAGELIKNPEKWLGKSEKAQREGEGRWEEWSSEHLAMSEALAELKVHNQVAKELGHGRTFSREQQQTLERALQICEGKMREALELEQQTEAKRKEARRETPAEARETLKEKTGSAEARREAQEKIRERTGQIEGRVEDGFIYRDQVTIELPAGTPPALAKEKIVKAFTRAHEKEVKKAIRDLPPEFSAIEREAVIQDLWAEVRTQAEKFVKVETRGDKDVYSRNHHFKLDAEGVAKLMAEKGRTIPEKPGAEATQREIEATIENLTSLINELAGRPTQAHAEKSKGLEGMHSLSSILEQGAAVCRHRALLFHHLAQQAGLNVRTVGGFLNGSRHAWNEVTLNDGTVLLVDVTNPPKPGGRRKEYRDVRGNLLEYPNTPSS